MCGIAGAFNFSELSSGYRRTVESMSDAIKHRGPDDSGLYISKNCILAHRRLSIIDLSSDGKQPFESSDGRYQMVFNGEIYNYLELKTDLEKKGITFKTKTDTEVIVKLYERYGVECLQHLQGMFAFALWDENIKQLFVARDRLGIKPLFIHTNHSQFCFASEIKSLLTLDKVSRDIDWTAIDAFFAYGYIPAPHTAYKSIQKLLPGHYMTISNGKVSLHQYWDLYFDDKFSCSEEDICEGFLDLLQHSVSDRMMSEVPLGCFLSGGVDSSLIVALMCTDNADAVNTFSMGYSGTIGNFMDERKYATEVSNRYKTTHYEFEATPDINEILDLTVSAFDEPFADDSIIPTFQICRHAKEKATVILSGLGGDENFSGYERHLGFRLSLLCDRLPTSWLENFFVPLIGSLKEQNGGHYKINHLKRFVNALSLEPSHRYQRYICPTTIQQRTAMYSKSVAKQIDFEKVQAMGHKYYDQNNASDPMDKMFFQDIKMYLPDDILAISDRVGMAHSLELRVPFVDHRVIEYCAKIPANLKIRGVEKKHLLKKVSKKYIPKSVISHRKQGFSSPMASWLRHDLKEYTAQILCSKHLDRQGIFNSAYVSSILSDHYERRSLNDKKIFNLLMAQRWLDRVI